MLAVERKHLSFKHPFTCMAAGPTSSDKTFLVRRILRHHMSIIYFKDARIEKLSLVGLWPMAESIRGRDT